MAVVFILQQLSQLLYLVVKSVSSRVALTANIICTKTTVSMEGHMVLGLATLSSIKFVLYNF